MRGVEEAGLVASYQLRSASTASAPFNGHQTRDVPKFGKETSNELHQQGYVKHAPCKVGSRASLPPRSLAQQGLQVFAEASQRQASTTRAWKTGQAKSKPGGVQMERHCPTSPASLGTVLHMTTRRQHTKRHQGPVAYFTRTVLYTHTGVAR